MSSIESTVPILLVTGFLGAGKTTLMNNLLSKPDGRRLAAVVNDFGAINIDAELLNNVSDDLISLKNGCICCSLQGDLLETLSQVLRRNPTPEGVVIETSGLSDPAEIVRSLLDPVIWRRAPLDTVICVADANAIVHDPNLTKEALWQAQLNVADYIAVSKTDLLNDRQETIALDILRKQKASDRIYAMANGQFPRELLFSASLHLPMSKRAFVATASHDFESVEWTSRASLDLVKFQRLIGELAEVIVRAKGIVAFSGTDTSPMVFQLVGRRATIGHASVPATRDPAVQLVFIGRRGRIDEELIKARLKACEVFSEKLQ